MKKEKEFYEKYIKDDRTEDEKMMEIIHSNARKRKKDKYIEKDRNNRKWIGSIILIGMSFILGIIIGGLWI